MEPTMLLLYSQENKTDMISASIVKYSDCDDVTFLILQGVTPVYYAKMTTIYLN